MVGRERSKNYFELYQDSIYKPLLDKGLLSTFPAGSPFKVIVGLIALEEKVITEKSTIFCKGQYIAFCDCDDLWRQNKLEKQIKFMKGCNLEFSFTSYEIINNNDLKIGFRDAQKNLSFKQLRNSCDIGLSTVMIKKNVFDNEKFRFRKTKTKEDFILWLILAKNGIPINGIKDCLMSWRKNSKSLSSSNIQKIIDGYKVYRNYLQYGRIKSFFFLIILSLNFMLKNIR